MYFLRWARAVVEGDELPRDPSNMILAQEDEVIQGVLTKCPVKAFNVGIRIWYVKGSRQYLDLQHPCALNNGPPRNCWISSSLSVPSGNQLRLSVTEVSKAWTREPR